MDHVLYFRGVTELQARVGGQMIPIYALAEPIVEHVNLDGAGVRRWIGWIVSTDHFVEFDDLVIRQQARIGAIGRPLQDGVSDGGACAIADLVISHHSPGLYLGEPVHARRWCWKRSDRQEFCEHRNSRIVTCTPLAQLHV